jgi:predicted ATPase/transcriptional regulator with XRE-family HTH domain
LAITKGCTKLSQVGSSGRLYCVNRSGSLLREKAKSAMNPKTSLGRWVKMRRNLLGLTQRELAQRIGCSLSVIQKIEIDARQPSPQMAQLLAEHLDLAPDEQPAFLHLARHQGNATLSPLPIVATRKPGNNLPTPLTPFIGREWEVTAVRAILLRPEVRLLTIIGPPGIGKTRLGMQVAAQVQEDFADGVCFITLAPVSDARFVVAAIARSLKIKDTGSEPLLGRVIEYLHSRQLLLVLDNFEHVLPAAPLIVELLEAVPQLKVLVSSRAALQVYGEHEFVVPPLALPDLKQLPPLDQLLRYAAVELFVQRVRAVRQEFTLSATNAPTVAAICVCLEGLPLAIELAAARSKVLPLHALQARLRDALAKPLDLLTGGQHLPTRHRTLRNAIAWSYDLLTPTEQQVFRCLGVFAGGCTLDAVAAVVSHQLSANNDQSALGSVHLSLNPEKWLLLAVQSLVNQNLAIQVEGPEGESRFILLEMIREYALEQLAEHGETANAQHAHTLYFLELSERFKTAAAETNAATLLSRMELEVDNFRTALRWADEHDLGLVLRFTLAMTEYWSQRHHLSEGRQWLEQLLSRLKAAGLPLQPQQWTQYAQISGMLAFFTWLQGDFVLAQSRWQATIALWRELQNWQELGLALHFLAYAFYDQGNYAAAYGPAQESVAILRQFGEPWALGWALYALGVIMTVGQEHDKAYALVDEALTIFHRIGHTWSISLAALGLSELFFAQGELERARTTLEQALPVFQKSDHQWMISQTLSNLGKVHWRQGDKQQAISLWNESVKLADEVGAKRFLGEIYFMLGLAAQERNDRQQAQALFRQSLAMYQAVANKIGVAYALSGLAGLAEQPVLRAQLAGAASTVLDTVRLPYDQIERLHYEQLVATVRTQLNETTFAVAWAKGQSISLDQCLLAIVDIDV